MRGAGKNKGRAGKRDKDKLNRKAEMEERGTNEKSCFG